MKFPRAAFLARHGQRRITQPPVRSLTNNCANDRGINITSSHVKICNAFFICVHANVIARMRSIFKMRSFQVSATGDIDCSPQTILISIFIERWEARHAENGHARSFFETSEPHDSVIEPSPSPKRQRKARSLHQLQPKGAPSMNGWLTKLAEWSDPRPLEMFAVAESDPHQALIAVQKHTGAAATGATGAPAVAEGGLDGKLRARSACQLRPLPRQACVAVQKSASL